MRKAINTIITAILLVTILASCYILDIAQQKIDYTEQVHGALQKLLQQQNNSLQGLNNHILPLLRMRDYKNLAKYLSAYEDVIFGLARQGYTLAGDLQYVSLSAPQIIVSSKGLLDETALVPDQKYYSLLVDDPYKLGISRQFIKSEMPDYPLVHFGLSVMDSMQNFYGVLDIQIACKAIREYLAHRVPRNNIFSFKIVDGAFEHPDIVINKPQLFVAGCMYVAVRFVLISIFVAVLYLVRTYLSKYKQQYQDIKRLHVELAIASKKLQLQDAALEVQHKYAAMNPYGDIEQRVNLSQLLRDIIAVNALAAYERGVVIQFDKINADNILIAYNRVMLMRILSGILYETILQLQEGGVISVSINISRYFHNSQKIEFCFKDNGYYEQLHGREVILSNNDVRCFGWQNIMALLAEHDIGLDHIHQVYKGNTLKLSIVSKFVNNVINFEKHLNFEEES